MPDCSFVRLTVKYATSLFEGASVANVGKNVGFLAASASKAVFHSTLSSQSNSASAARSSNLGDVTAKAGSQAIAASLLGTALGIAFSWTFCSDYGATGMLAGFVALSVVHQVCTYKAVKAVPLKSLDRHRLHIVLTAYITENYRQIVAHNGRNDKRDGCDCAIPDINEEGGKTLSPAQVAEKECFLPMVPPDDSARWLAIGDSLEDICPLGVVELEGLLLRNETTRSDCAEKSRIAEDVGNYNPKYYERYILKMHPSSTGTAVGDGMIQLTFCDGATDYDVIRGMLHAYLAHEVMKNDSNSNFSSSQQLGCHNLLETHTMMAYQMPTLVERLEKAGWQVGKGFVNVECGSSYRFNIQQS